jgi:enoyl-CoA hydratase
MSKLIVETAGKVVTVIIDRPPVKALTIALYGEIADTFDAIGARDDVDCAILTGRGERAFCAGLDLKEFLAATPEQDPERAKIVRRTFSAVRHCALPVIAAVNGPALGAGCVLASVCDIRLATPNATFGLPEINVGRCGGAAHMGRNFPQGLLRRMFFTGKPIGVDEAQRYGFVDEIVPTQDLMPAAIRLAEIIAGKAPLGLRLGKKSLNEIEFIPVEAGYAREQEYSTQLMRTEDAREPPARWSKSAPRFQGTLITKGIGRAFGAACLRAATALPARQSAPERVRSRGHEMPHRPSSPRRRGPSSPKTR